MIWFLDGISLMKRKAGIQSFNNYVLALMWKLRSLVLVPKTTKYERINGYVPNKWKIIPLNLIHCNERHFSILLVIIILGFMVLVTLYLIIHATITLLCQSILVLGTPNDSIKSLPNNNCNHLRLIPMAHRNNAQRILETMVTNLFIQRNPPKPLSTLDWNNVISSWK